MLNKLVLASLLFLISIVALSCEVDTKLTIKGGNPPEFNLSGSGVLGWMVIRGHKQQRKIEGPDASAYWYIEAKDENSPRSLGRLSPIAYGKVPEGYTQVYPDSGEPPPLLEGQRYYVQAETVNANGASLWFIIRNGKVEFSEYEHSLQEN